MLTMWLTVGAGFLPLPLEQTQLSVLAAIFDQYNTIFDFLKIVDLILWLDCLCMSFALCRVRWDSSAIRLELGAWTQETGEKN